MVVPTLRCTWSNERSVERQGHRGVIVEVETGSKRTNARHDSNHGSGGTDAMRDGWVRKKIGPVYQHGRRSDAGTP